MNHHPITDDSSTKNTDKSEEIEVPTSFRSPSKILMRQDVPVYLTEESKWSKNYQVINTFCILIL